MRRLLSTLLLALATTAHATGGLSDTIALGEVEVTALTKRETIKPRVISGEGLKKLNSQSVADAMRYFSGVQVKDYGGIGGIKTINIRNMGTQHVGIYYDGIQLGNAQNGQIDLGRYSLDNIEEIRLYNGQRSDIFQGAREFGSSGTVYITTRRPRWEGNERYHLTGQFHTGSFGLVNPDFTFEYKLSDTWSLSASAAYTNANGRYRFRYRRLNADNTVAYDTTATRHNSDIEALRTEISAFGFHDQMQWSGKLYFYTSDRGIPGAIVNNVFRNGERQWDKNFFAQASFSSTFSSVYSMKASSKWAWDFMHFLRDDPRELYINNRYYQQEAYISIANMFKITPLWSASAATDFQWNTMNASMTDFAYPTRMTGMLSAATSINDWHGLSAQASILATMIRDRAHGRTSHCTEWTPALFASWRVPQVKGLTINAFFKRAFRMPTFNDLYYTEIGNKSLKPERTTQYDIGTAYTLPLHGTIKSISFQADGYYNRVTDKIVAYPSGQQFRWTMLNLGKVNIWGIDATASADAAVREWRFRLQLNYTWQRATDVTDPTDSYYGNLIPYSPVHSGSVNFNADWRGWNLNYSFIYTGERYNAQENVPLNHEEPWYTHDASLFYNFSWRRCRYRAGLELNNIFNQAYEVIRNYPMPGRNFKIVLRIEL